MPSYIYCPIMTDELELIAQSWNYGRIAKGKQAYAIVSTSDQGKAKAVRRFFSGNLKGVQGGDKLYILCHGIADGSKPCVAIGATRGAVRGAAGLSGYEYTGGRQKILEPGALARHLDKEGLTKEIQDVRVFACGSGLPSDNLDPYAVRLLNAMTVRGYHSIKVTGYLGKLDADYSLRPPVGSNGSYKEGEEPWPVAKGIQLPDRTSLTDFCTRAKNHKQQWPSTNPYNYVHCREFEL